jgi:hypothetical protein
MIIYSITYQVNEGVAEAWLDWLHQTHLPRVKLSERFFRHTLQELVDPQPIADIRTFNLQLYTMEVEHLYTYWDEDAQILDGAMAERFGDKVSYFETVMKRLPQLVV